jgi:hypothetical protein
MMGEINGVAGKLNRRVPHIVILHCVAHKLELAVLDAVKEVPYLKEFDDTVKAVFKLYRRSPKKKRELKEIGEIVEEKVWITDLLLILHDINYNCITYKCNSIF